MRSKLSIRLMAVACLASICASALIAAEPAAIDGPASTPGPSATLNMQDEVVQEFEVQRAAFEALNSEIESVVERFRAASEEERPSIQAEYDAAVEKLQEAVPRLEQATLAAYEVTKETNQDVSNMMLRLALTYVSNEQYQKSLGFAQQLIDAGCETEGVFAIAGLAAYGSNEFEDAKQYWDRAKQAGTMSADMERFANGLDGILESWRKEVEIRQVEAAANDLPRVELVTNKGPIVIELFENQAPGAVGNFVSLVEKGYYDGLSFHRVLPQFMAQGGCPDGTGAGGPGYKIYCECEREDYRRHFAGTLSMAHAGKDTGGSQFFITFLPTTHLDGRHTAFGRVIEGWDVLAKLQRINPQSPNPNLKPDIIEKATLLRKRNHEYQPNRVEN